MKKAVRIRDVAHDAFATTSFSIFTTAPFTGLMLRIEDLARQMSRNCSGPCARMRGAAMSATTSRVERRHEQDGAEVNE